MACKMDGLGGWKVASGSVEGGRGRGNSLSAAKMTTRWYFH